MHLIENKLGESCDNGTSTVSSRSSGNFFKLPLTVKDNICYTCASNCIRLKSNSLQAGSDKEDDECIGRNSNMECTGGRVAASQVEYAAVIVNNKINKTKDSASGEQRQQQKSFLHTVYGCALNQPISDKDDPSMSRNPLRKNIQRIIAKYSIASASDSKRAVPKAKVINYKDSRAAQKATTSTQPVATMASVDTAKNYFLHSLLEEDSATTCQQELRVNTDQVTDIVQEPSPLDDIEIQSSGPEEMLIISRDGTRASIRLKLSAKPVSRGSSFSRANSFNRAYRNSRRASHRSNSTRRTQVVVTSTPEVSPATTPTPITTAAEMSLAYSTTETSMSDNSLQISLVTDNASMPADTNNVTMSRSNSKRTRSSIRRRSSPGKVAAKKGFTMSVAIPTSKVATLASKFNSLINESKQTCESVAHSKKKTIRSHRLLSSHVIETIPEVSPCKDSDSIDNHCTVHVLADAGSSATRDCGQANKKTGHSELTRSVSHAATENQVKRHANSTNTVYGTVKSKVKQAIRKFEKMDDRVMVNGGAATPSENNACSDKQHSSPENDVHKEAGEESHSPYSSIKKESLVANGITPNTSFLWRDTKSTQNLIYEATLFKERTNSVTAVQNSSAANDGYYDMGSSNYDTLHSRRSNAYDSLKPNINDDSYNSYRSSSSHGYDLIGPPQLPGYDEIQSPRSSESKYQRVIALAAGDSYDNLIKRSSISSVTYDELMFPRRLSDGYDELHSLKSSSDGYIDPGNNSTITYQVLTVGKVNQRDNNTIGYEECGTATSNDVVVTAVPALVRDDQLDAISYDYDDIHGYGGYSGSNHSYEPIYAHLSGSTTQSSMLPVPKETQQVCNDLASHDDLSVDSEDQVHEVCSYRLTQMGPSAITPLTNIPSCPATVPDSPAPSLATSRAGTERRSETSDEWLDISDEEPAYIVTRARHDPQLTSFSRRGLRQSRRRPSASKTNQTWSQTMRALVKNGFNKAIYSHSKETCGKSSKSSHSASKPATPGKKLSARRLPSAETEASGTGSSQAWEDFGESDGDELADDHHYEALYEVINPKKVVEHTDDSFDDSFESDDAFEESIVRHVDTTSDTSRERPGSRSGSDRSKESEDPSLRSQYGIAKFAGAQMQKLRRNWSSTKTDISKSISRIKKRSTVSVAELGEVFKKRENSPEKTSNSVPEKEVPNGLSTTVAVDEPNQPKKSSTWALRKLKRRATMAPMDKTIKLSLDTKKLSSTFYLTLTIESSANSESPAYAYDDVEFKVHSAPVELPNPEQAEKPAPLPPLAGSSVSNVPVRPRRTSSASPSSCHSPMRPKTAPPDPPTRPSATPPPAGKHVPEKKPLSRLATANTGHSKSLSSIQTLIKECRAGLDQHATNSTINKNDPREIIVSASDTPNNHMSLVSSNDSYMGVGELASCPEHMRSDRQNNGEDAKSYIDLQPAAETDELFVSSHFADEPLYQFYTAAIIERAAHNQGEVSGEEDDYEVIGEHIKKEESRPELETEKKVKLPTAMELVMPASGRRTLWCELPEVISSGLLDTVTGQQRKLQEAMFELITSEASYLRSLNVMTTHFIQNEDLIGDDAVLSRIEHHALFSDIIPVWECSERMLADFEKRWQESVFIREICDILLEHATKYFEVYIRYCTNQLHQERTLRELKETRPQFVEVLKRLEASPICQSLAMHSFLMLPMQRITRLPLLVDAIFHRLEAGSEQFDRCRLTLATLNKIVQECNEGARKAERIHEMLIVSNQLDFAEVKAISIMSASRWLVKKGELQRLSWRDIDARLTFGRKIHKQTVYIFLFTDLLVITKKKGDDAYTVLDYCPRNMVQVDEYTRTEKSITKSASDLGKNLILMTMLQNHENKTVEMIMSCSSESDRTRWLEAVTPRTSDNPEEKIYEEWDCPQVQAIHPYVSTQPDELPLEVTDVVNVLRKMADGWYQGERIRDGERGWFPGNYTMEIASAHVRARNLRQRYRLLALSGNFIEEQARKEREEQKRRSKKLAIE